MTAPLPQAEKDARAVARVWRKHAATAGGLTLWLVVSEAQYHRPEQPREKTARDLLDALTGEAVVDVRRPQHDFWKRVRELVES